MMSHYVTILEFPFLLKIEIKILIHTKYLNFI